MVRYSHHSGGYSVASGIVSSCPTSGISVYASISSETTALNMFIQPTSRSVWDCEKTCLKRSLLTWVLNSDTVGKFLTSLTEGA